MGGAESREPDAPKVHLATFPGGWLSAPMAPLHIWEKVFLAVVDGVSKSIRAFVDGSLKIWYEGSNEWPNPQCHMRL
jgi:hypothetical protein